MGLTGKSVAQDSGIGMQVVILSTGKMIYLYSIHIYIIIYVCTFTKTLVKSSVYLVYIYIYIHTTKYTDMQVCNISCNIELFGM